MTDAPVNANAPHATVANVRAKIASGELAMARTMLEALHRRAGPLTDVLVTEGLLWEAEGDLEAGVASFQRAAAAAPHSVHANAQLGRLLMLLGRVEEAAAAAIATLALDDVNSDALTVLADVHRHNGRTEERLGVLHKLALSPAPSEKAWQALDELATAKQWRLVVDVLDRRGPKWPPPRVAMRRLEALLELGQERAALACLLASHSIGHLQTDEVVDRLFARGALGAAAGFVHQALPGQSGEARAREAVMRLARQIRDGETLEESPLAFADAVRALDILDPDSDASSEAVARTTAFLLAQARTRLAEGGYSLATDLLIAAARLQSADRTTLELLADAALKAGRPDRHLDTLLRIRRAFPDARILTAVLDAALSAERWGVIPELMSEAEDVVAGAPAENKDVADQLRLRLRRRLDDFMRDQDWEGGLALVTGLSPWMNAADWRDTTVSRLLARAKRRVRNQRSPHDTSDARIWSMYLLVDPADVDVQRLLARVRFRQRDFTDVIDILSRVVVADPHLARDWVDLATAHHQFGDVEQRDACTSRALVISPTIPLPTFSAVFRARIGA